MVCKITKKTSIELAQSQHFGPSERFLGILTPNNMIMSVFKTEDEREVEVLSKLEKQIERREKIHRFLIAGLSGMLFLSVAAHIACHFSEGKRRRR